MLEMLPKANIVQHDQCCATVVSEFGGPIKLSIDRYMNESAHFHPLCLLLFHNQRVKEANLASYRR